MNYKVGDTAVIDVPVARRWWQLWKPRHWRERREFVVTSVLPEKRIAYD